LCGQGESQNECEKSLVHKVVLSETVHFLNYVQAKVLDHWCQLCFAVIVGIHFPR
jgi:hypothetical protein